MNKKEYNHQHYLKHKGKRRQQQKAWADSHRERMRELSRKSYYKNREKSAERRRKWYRQNRLKMLKKLGGKCVKCGIEDLRVLQVDHINGGGTQEYKEIGWSLTFFSKVLKDNQKEYQLLCANCNWIKKWEKNENRKPWKNL